MLAGHEVSAATIIGTGPFRTRPDENAPFRFWA